jgi:similar to spore coat protein
MEQQGLAPNESIQLHEILTVRNLTLTKAITMSPLVADEELKMLIQNEIKTSQRHIRELKGYLELSMIATPTEETHEINVY